MRRRPVISSVFLIATLAAAPALVAAPANPRTSFSDVWPSPLVHGHDPQTPLAARDERTDPPGLFDLHRQLPVMVRFDGANRMQVMINRWSTVSEMDGSWAGWRQLSVWQMAGLAPPNTAGPDTALLLLSPPDPSLIALQQLVRPTFSATQRADEAADRPRVARRSGPWDDSDHLGTRVLRSQPPPDPIAAESIPTSDPMLITRSLVVIFILVLLGYPLDKMVRIWLRHR